MLKETIYEDANYTELAQDRMHLRVLLKAAMKLRAP
jgi:hypothetical protein